ncbi:hypothetical protein Hanom_Chr10g00946321 [Helianthus anomalus]
MNRLLFLLPSVVDEVTKIHQEINLDVVALILLEKNRRTLPKFLPQNREMNDKLLTHSRED